MHSTRILLASIFALISLAPLARADDINLSTLQPTNKAKVQKTDEGLQITGTGRVLTPNQYTTPLTVTAVAKTDANNIRLFFAKGAVILNWEVNNNDLRLHNPVDGSQNHFDGKGSVPVNQFVTVVWIIDKDGVSLSVDGEFRGSFSGNFDNLTSQVGIGTVDKSVVVFKSLSIQAKKSTTAGHDSTPLSSEYIDVPVTTGPHATTLPAAPANADPDDIERPQYQTVAKPLLKNLTSITSMMVTIDDDGTEHGITNDIIATVPAQSRKANSSGIGFISNDGDDTMKVGLQEAVRAVTLRYPIWEHGHIDLSFSEKFVAHGGPSAATAFGVLMLSTLEGFSIDPKCAVTGDITVDWKVRKIGGVTAKLHGATLDNCLYAAIPEDNASALSDLALLDGPSALWNIQIFSIATLQDAVAITRKDRDPKLTQAMKEFADLEPTLAADKSTLKSTATQSALKHILILAPNHISAKYLLLISQGLAPKHLSSSAALHQLSAIIYPYVSLFQKSSDLTGEGIIHLSPAISALSRKRISDLRPLVSPDFAPLLLQLSAFVETSAGLANHNATLDPLKTRIDSLRAALTTVTTDKDFTETLSREGF